jgi:hypothetical protein
MIPCLPALGLADVRPVAVRLLVIGREEETVKLRNFLRRLWRKTDQDPPRPDSPDPAVMQRMVTQLARTRAQELSCDEVYELLDVFAEHVRRGEDAAALLPLVHHHLEMCPDCREELTALLRSIEATTPER